MSAGQSAGGGKRDSISRDTEQRETPGEAMTSDASPDILGPIIAETASHLTQLEDAGPELRAAMLAVARKYAGQLLLVDGPATALLEAVLQFQLPILASRSELLAKTARAVAGSLLADPAARLRLEHLWAKLQEEAV